MGRSAGSRVRYRDRDCLTDPSVGREEHRMKYGITADLQFDEYARLSTLSEQGVTTRLLDLIACFRWIVQTCVDQGCKGLIVAGDVFESRTAIDITVLDLVCREFRRAATVLDITVVAGNHDCHLKTPDLSSLQALKGSATVITEPTVIAPFAFVPWSAYEEDYRAAVKKLAKEPDAKYLVSHALIEGAGYPGKNIPVDVFKPSRWKRVLLGDVHCPMQFTIDGWEGDLRYVGAPMQLDFGDADEWRGFCILDTKTDALELVENEISPRFHKVTDPDDLEDVRDIDFVDVRGDDPVKVMKVLKKAQDVAHWVGGSPVEVENTKPRIQATTSTKREEVLSRYCQYMGIPDANEMVALGMDILAEAEE
jgi:DNA repair exonuclease SbcCD nuclease subunit